MAIERGTRKEECRRHVLHAVVRNDQCLQNIALALGEPKGGNEAIEPIVKRKPGASRGTVSAWPGSQLTPRSSVASASLPRVASPSPSCPNCPNSEIAMPTNSTSTTLTAASTF